MMMVRPFVVKVDNVMCVATNVGVEVNWEQATYSGNEGSVVSVCARHLQQTQRDFTINIMASNSSGK